MSEKPKVSYVCSVKDGEKEIERCAMSVLGQSVREIELILVDDHSGDGTWEAIQSIAAKDNRVRGVRNQGMEGLTYSLNIGLDFAKGDYVARIDADDFAHINRTERQLSLMDATPDAAMCATAFRVVDHDDWDLYSHCPSCDPKLLKWSLCFRNNIRHSTAMWRRSLDLRYEPSFKYAQDYELWCRIARIGQIAVLPEVVVTIKNMPKSISRTKHEEQEVMADRVSAEQYEFYTGVRINQKQARNLRMVHHLKSSDQFKVFDSIGTEDFADAVERYCRLAEAFFARESPEMDGFLVDIGHDIRSLVENPSKERDASRAVRKISKLFGRSSLAFQIERNFLKSAAKVY